MKFCVYETTPFEIPYKEKRHGRAISRRNPESCDSQITDRQVGSSIVYIILLLGR